MTDNDYRNLISADNFMMNDVSFYSSITRYLIHIRYLKTYEILLKKIN